MTPHEFREARYSLGLSQNQLARLMNVSDGRTVRKWEQAERDIPGPAVRLLTAYLEGYRPEDWPK